MTYGSQSRHLGIVCCALFVAGCSSGTISPPPPAAKASSVPGHGTNALSLGLVRVRMRGGTDIKGTDEPVIQWMMKHGMPTMKAGYFIGKLREAGFDTLLLVLPGDDSILEDAGFYIGGPSTKTRDDVEDILIMVGGTEEGLVGSALTVVPVGNGWFFVGLNGDGVIDGASDGDARFLSNLLDRLGDHPAAAVISFERIGLALGDANDRLERYAELEEQRRENRARPRISGRFDEDLDAAIDQDEEFQAFLEQVGEYLSENQSRLVRRLQAAWSALAIADGLAGIVNDAGRAGIQLVYPSPEAAELLVKAMDRIRRDMSLAVKGGLEQGEIDREKAAAYEADINKLKVERIGSSVLLWEE